MWHQNVARDLLIADIAENELDSCVLERLALVEHRYYAQAIAVRTQCHAGRPDCRTIMALRKGLGQVAAHEATAANDKTAHGNDWSALGNHIPAFAWL